MYLLDVNGKTVFAKLTDVYAACQFLIADAPQLHPLICLKSSCPRNANCMEHLAKIVKFIFDRFEAAQLLFLYFSYRDLPGSQRAGVFWRDMRDPRYITFNRSAWEKLKKMGTVYELNIPNELLLGGSFQPKSL